MCCTSYIKADTQECQDSQSHYYIVFHLCSDKVGYCPPCGNCRQVIFEFGQETNCKILLVNNPSNKECVQTSICDLLTSGFGPADLNPVKTTSTSKVT